MKKIMTLLVAAMFCLTGTAKTADEVISELEKATSAQVIRFDKTMLASYLGKADSKKMEKLKNIDNGCVLIIEDADKAKVEKFNKITDELDDKSYEPLVTVFDGDDRVKVLGHVEGETVKEVFITVADGEDCVMVHLNCNIPKSEIDSMINKDTFSFN